MAAVSLPFDFQGELKYKWIFTENIFLSDGENTGKIANLKANRKYPVEIKVKGFSNLENRQIVFQIWGFHKGKKIFSSGIISTNKENTFENIVQNVEKIKAEDNK